MKFAKASKVDISLSVFYYKNYQKEVSYNFQNLKTLEKLLSVIWTQCFIWQYQWWKAEQYYNFNQVKISGTAQNVKDG